LEHFLDSWRHVILVSVVTGIEFRSTLERKIRFGELLAASRSQSAQARCKHGEFYPVDLSNEVSAEAAELIQRQALRSLDAIQLASAVVAAQQLKIAPSDVLFICSDHRLLAAAAAESLLAWDPATAPAPIL
jgi:hypothetical protein